MPAKKYFIDEYVGFGAIYKIVNTLNGKIYIGQTKRRVRYRIYQHVKKQNKKQTAIYNAIKKYGIEQFHIEIIDVGFDRPDLNAKEKFWIKEYKSLAPNGYNLTSGGESNFEVSAEVRAKISSSNKNRVFTPEVRANMSRGIRAGIALRKQLGIIDPRIGSKRTEDAKRKTSQTLKAARRKLSPDRVEKLTAHRRGQKDPALAERNRQRKGFKWTEEQKARKKVLRGEEHPNYGKTLGVHTRAKIAASRLGRGAGKPLDDPQAERERLRRNEKQNWRSEVRRALAAGIEPPPPFPRLKRVYPVKDKPPKIYKTAEERRAIAKEAMNRPEVRAKLSAATKKQFATTGHPWKGRHHTDETKAVMSAAKKDKPLSPEHIANLSKAGKGRKKSAEHIEKIRQSNIGVSRGKGRPKSEAHKSAIAAARVGLRRINGVFVHTDEGRKKRRATPARP